MLWFRIFQLLPLFYGCNTVTAKTLFIKRPHSFDFAATDERDYHHCPMALEVENNNKDEYFDLEYLDSLCKNVGGVVRMRISGNFYGVAEVLFTKLPRLEDFEGNDMENLTDIHLATWNLKHIDLSRNSLQKISIEIMDELSYLNLSYNHLSDENILMSSMRPSLSLKLKTLDLSHNEISRLDSLYPFWNLRKFILSNNRIAFIKPGILQRYPNLVTLDLARNKIYDLPNGMFTGLIHLLNLDLSFNRLTDAKIRTINFLRGLEFLDMNGNNIKKFNYEELDHHLEILRVNDYHTYIHGKRMG